MGIGIVFAGPIVTVLGGGLMRSEFLQRHILIMQQPVLGVVDVNAGGNVHRIY